MNRKDKEAAFQLWQSTPLYVTPEGLKRLEQKLARLEAMLPGLIAETARTRAYGDTSDNFEYKEAKLQSRRTQRQILTIQDQLKKVVLIEPGANPDGTIRLGSKVVLEGQNGEKRTYEILGPQETNPSAGRISLQSPLGAALLGKAVKDRVKVTTPGGEKEYLIIEIQ
jgi:transcription elongation GreA/GreB family factor